jgi:hypothetical protein
MWTRCGWKWLLIALFSGLVQRTVAEPQFKNPVFERDFKAINPSDPDPYFPSQPTYMAKVSSDSGPVPVSTSISYSAPIPAPAPAPAPTYAAAPAPAPVPVPTYAAAPAPAPAPVPSYAAAPAPAPAPVPSYASAPSAQGPTYNVPAAGGASYAYAPPAQGGYYYYYYPTKTPSSVKAKDMWDGMKKYLLDDQKVWIAVVVPLIVVALGLPLLAILFSGKVRRTAHLQIALK